MLGFKYFLTKVSNEMYFITNFEEKTEEILTKKTFDKINFDDKNVYERNFDEKTFYERNFDHRNFDEKTFEIRIFVKNTV